MKLFSTKLGEFEFNEENVLHFPLGIPGFDSQKKFILVTKKNIPYFYFLQSVEDENLMFILTDPFIFYDDYSFQLTDEELLFLKIKNKIEFGKDVFVFSIVTIKGNEKKFSLNLKAPVIINFREKIGKQVILYDYNYPVRFEIDFNKKNRKIVDNVNFKIAQAI